MSAIFSARRTVTIGSLFRGWGQTFYSPLMIVVLALWFHRKSYHRSQHVS